MVYRNEDESYNLIHNIQVLVFVLESIQGLSPSSSGSTVSVLRLIPFFTQSMISPLHLRMASFLVVFFDFQKAYDTTWKRGVLRKLLSL